MPKLGPKPRAPWELADRATDDAVPGWAESRRSHLIRDALLVLLAAALSIVIVASDAPAFLAILPAVSLVAGVLMFRADLKAPADDERPH